LSIRRSALGLLGAAVLAVSACSSTGASSLPNASAIASAIASLAPAGSAIVDPNSLEGFCAAFTDAVAPKWPNIDASTAATVGPIIREWANIAALSTVKADATTVFDWVATQSVSTTTASPPPDVTAAFDRIKAFADTNC